VHHPAVTDRDGPEVFQRGEDGLIVQYTLLVVTPVSSILWAGTDLCNRIQFSHATIQLPAAKECHCERSEAISALKGRDC
jgi:hypothetical protein